MTIDLNTIINVIVLGLTAWTLRTVHDMAKAQAATVEKHKAIDATLDEDRCRIMDVESKVTDLQLDVARVQHNQSRHH